MVATFVAKDFYFADPWQWMSLYASIMFLFNLFGIWRNGEEFLLVVRAVKATLSGSKAAVAVETPSLAMDVVRQMNLASFLILMLNGLCGIVFCLTGIFVNLWYNDAVTGKGIPPGFMDMDDKVRWGYSLSAFILMLIDVILVTLITIGRTTDKRDLYHVLIEGGKKIGIISFGCITCGT